MEKTMARFLSTETPAKYNGGIRKDGVEYNYVEYDEATTERIMAEASEYFVSKDVNYYYSEDVHNTSRSGSYNSGAELKDLVSISSGMYSTDMPQGDILVLGREFAGVILRLVDKTGGTWSYTEYDWYAIFYKDGSVDGKRKTIKSISLEDSDTDDTTFYYLVKKNKNA